MRSENRTFRYGVTLVEMSVVIAISSILTLVIGILVVGGQRAWSQTYDKLNSQTKQDAQAVMATFGSIGRRSNRLGYTIYNIDGSTFIPTVPQTSNPEEVVSGDAVEFRYWDVELDLSDSYGLMDVTKTATVYALFYVNGTDLKVDYGPYPPGAVPADGGSKNTANITTTTLAENVSIDPDIGVFSHTTLNGVGRGCVRINITLEDTESDDNIKVMTATMMRNIWPR